MTYWRTVISPLLALERHQWGSKSSGECQPSASHTSVGGVSDTVGWIRVVSVACSFIAAATRAQLVREPAENPRAGDPLVVPTADNRRLIARFAFRGPRRRVPAR